jgi:hypothetical protein
MHINPVFSFLAIQGSVAPDTTITKVITERGVLDWTNGVLGLVVLLLAIGALTTLVLLLITMRKSIIRTNAVVEKLAEDSRPLIATVHAVATDAREVVAMLRTDVERVTDAAGAISEQLLDIADAATQRVDELNAVIDVLQDEIEDTAIGAIAAVRGVRVGARELTHRRRPGKAVESEQD